MRTCLIILALVVAGGLIVFALTATPTSQAQSLLPFGGQILFVDYCCNGLHLTVGPPNPGWFLFTVGSILYPYYNIYTPGPWVLGNAEPGGVCFTGPLCVVPVPMTGTILQVGTSEL